jgi:hypothetical protein
MNHAKSQAPKQHRLKTFLVDLLTARAVFISTKIQMPTS